VLAAGGVPDSPHPVPVVSVAVRVAAVQVGAAVVQLVGVATARPPFAAGQLVGRTGPAFAGVAE